MEYNDINLLGDYLDHDFIELYQVCITYGISDVK